MSTIIDRRQLQDLVAHGAQLVEALPAVEYADAHLPGALNLPLKQLPLQTAAQLGHARPVIAYCNDYQWDVAPRAALRLERFGFEPVYLYAPGKWDWFAYGLPMLGERAKQPQAKDVVR